MEATFLDLLTLQVIMSDDVILASN